MKLRWHSVQEVLSRTVQDPIWLAFPLLTPGAITLLGGEPKTSGKTTLAFAALKAMAQGERFLARDTSSGTVAYLTEEHPSTLSQAIRRVKLHPKTPGLHFLYRYEYFNTPWPELTEQLYQECRKGKWSAVIVDTWTKWTAIDEGAERDVATIHRAMSPLLRIKALDVAVLINHHTKKAEGQSVVSQMAGHNALAGAVDIVAGYRRVSDVDEELRELEVISRFDCANGKYGVQLLNGRVEVGSL